MKSLVSQVFAVCLTTIIAVAPAYAETAKGTPDEVAIKKMKELGMPGEQHKVLDALAGSWNYTVTYKMAPDAPEEISSGTSNSQWILDGRFIQQKVSGTMDMNKDGKTEKFEGVGLIGHDNVTGKYRSIWVDNVSTGMMTASGTYDAATKTIKESGHYSCPVKGEEVKFNSELHFTDADHHTYTMYDQTPEGQTYKSMEIKYTRKK